MLNLAEMYCSFLAFHLLCISVFIHIPLFYFMYIDSKCVVGWDWWLIPLIPGFWRQSQAVLWVRGTSLVYIESSNAIRRIHRHLALKNQKSKTGRGNVLVLIKCRERVCRIQMGHLRHVPCPQGSGVSMKQESPDPVVTVESFASLV